MNSIKQRILVIGPIPPPFGGVANFVKNLIEQDALCDKYDMYLYRIGKNAHLSSLKLILIEISRLIKYPFELKRKKINLVHVHLASYLSFLRGSLYITMTKFLSKSKIIVHIHGAEFDIFFKRSHPIIKKLIKFQLKLTDCIIVVSDSWIVTIKDILKEDHCIVSLPNGFNQRLFHITSQGFAREVLRLPKDKKILLSIGHLEEYKGHKYLINSMKKIIESRRDVNLYIIGKGTMEKYLQSLIEQYGLQDHVFLAGGNKTDEDLFYWMNSCDIFVLPSLKESFGIVQIEAMACGKPVVATYNGGSEDIILDRRLGNLVKPKDIDELARAILSALDREWDKEFILEYGKRFAWNNIAKKIIQIYKQVLSNEDL